MELKHTSNKHWAKEETKIKIISYLEINNGNIIYQSTQRKTYSLKCIYLKKHTTMIGYSECHDPRERYK